MNIQQKITLDIIAITGLLAFFGYIFGKNPFASLAIFLLLLGVTWIGGSIISLPMRPIEHSLTSIIFAFACIVFAFILLCIFPKQGLETKNYSEDEMGQYQNSEWVLRIYYQKHGLTSSEQIEYTGSTEQSENAMKVIVNHWNSEHPEMPVTKSERILSYIPKSYAKKNGYPLVYSQRY